MTVHVEVLVVPDCPNEAAATELIQAAATNTGVFAIITRTEITTHEQAQERGFTGSPTILVNGIDPFARPGQPVALTCRLYTSPAGLQGIPALIDLSDAVTEAARR